MTETDAAGHTSASDMDQGLYLVVETRVPENVTSTCNPFLISLPMTTIDGSEWLYDLTVYPKNQTGNPTLSKTVREVKNSTGRHNGSLTDITDGFEHTATASVGDVVDYQIISTLPTITSKASSLSEYTYVDTMSKGIKYNKQDIVIEFFKDAGCTDKITTWNENSGKFTVTYDDAANTMTIKMTEAGLSEINESESVYTDNVKRGYSDCTMRITYAATLTADAQMGDKDNPNTVTLTWKRTNTTYYDTLEDCCHVYTYGIDVLKQFSDGKGDIQNVKFLLHNDSDDCYIIADLKDGIYYAKGITTKKSDATTFVPNSSGHIIVKGLEDDSYSLTETATDKGYVLLKDAVKIIIKAAENGQCEKCGAKLLTASATVNGKDVTMTGGNAIVPLTVINNPGFDLPKTGGYGTWMFICCLDESSSTESEAAAWGKAVAMTLLEIAAESRRRFALIHFAGSSSCQVDIFRPGEYTLEDKLTAAETFLGGGTNFERPIREALRLMDTEGFEKADVVFITDGECELPDASQQELQVSQAAYHFTVTGVLLDKGRAGMGFSLEPFCQKIYRTSELIGDAVVQSVINLRV